MLVASLLLSMLVVALSMVFSSSASAWRIGRAGVDGLHRMRHDLSGYQLAADNALPNLKGEGSGIGYIRSQPANAVGRLRLHFVLRDLLQALLQIPEVTVRDGYGVSLGHNCLL